MTYLQVAVAMGEARVRLTECATDMRVAADQLIAQADQVRPDEALVRDAMMKDQIARGCYLQHLRELTRLQLIAAGWHDGKALAAGAAAAP